MNYLLNELVDILEKESHAAKGDAENSSSPSEKVANGPKAIHENGAKKEPLVTWVHKNFQVSSGYHSDIFYDAHVISCGGIQ